MVIYWEFVRHCCAVDIAAKNSLKVFRILDHPTLHTKTDETGCHPHYLKLDTFINAFTRSTTHYNTSLWYLATCYDCQSVANYILHKKKTHIFHLRKWLKSVMAYFFQWSRQEAQENIRYLTWIFDRITFALFSQPVSIVACDLQLGKQNCPW